MKAAANSHLEPGASCISWIILPLDGVIRSPNPYGPGMLYQTGREARIMPDGRLEFLEQGGRTVMREGLTGRKFLDLYKLEQTLESADGVTKAEAYVRYGEGNKLVLQADVWGVSEADTERLRAYVREHCGEALVPECISCF